MRALEKYAFAVTDEGHKLDKEEYQAVSDYFNKSVKAHKEYADKAPIREFLLNGLGGKYEQELARNRMQEAAIAHKHGHNLYSPTRGWTDREYERNRSKYIKHKK